MMDKAELTAREAETWATFRSEVDALTPEQMELPAANDDGWSVKDVLWHIAHWWSDLAGMIEEVNAGTPFVEPPEDDEATDAENARVLEESRALALDDVVGGVADARARLLAAWLGLAQVDPALEQWFVWETIEHYEEHLEDVRRVAAG